MLKAVGVMSRDVKSAVAGAPNQQQANVGRAQDFWRTVQRIPAGAEVAADPESRRRQIVVVSGWIAETRILPDGRRQIFDFLLAGDVASVCDSHMGGRSFIALTNVEIADAAALTSCEGSERASASIAAAIHRREQRLFDHIVRIGRLTAKERVLNLLFELYDRLEAIGLVKDNAFKLPITQEVFADALGLSVVHISRTLKELRGEGMLTIGRGLIALHQRRKFAAVA